MTTQQPTIHVPSKPQAPYLLDSKFERGAITLACCCPSFYGRIGHLLDPQLLADERGRRALEAAKHIYRELGTGPSSLLIVMQKLKSYERSGRLTLEQISATNDYMDEAVDAVLPKEEEAVAMIAPILANRLNEQGIRTAMSQFGQKLSLEPALDMFQRAQGIGKRDVTLGVKVGDASFDAIDELLALERLPTGITELDLMLGGGLYRGGLGVVLAASGVGKSLMLDQMAGNAVTYGKFVAVATLEVPQVLWTARVKAHLLDVPFDVIVGNDTRAKINARKKFANQVLGPMVVRTFPTGTTNQEIEAWVAEVEEAVEREIDLLVVDYGDKMGVRRAPGSRESSDYDAGRVIFEGLRLYAERRKKWCWTASQAQRLKDKKMRIDLEHVADSVHKMRVANLVVTLTQRGENDDELLIFCAKHTMGKSRFSIGPLPTDYEMGRAVVRT